MKPVFIFTETWGEYATQGVSYQNFTLSKGKLLMHPNCHTAHDAAYARARTDKCFFVAEFSAWNTALSMTTSQRPSFRDNIARLSIYLTENESD